MIIYRFSDDSMISEIAVTNDVLNRSPTALLTANPNTSADQIAKIRLEMEAYGWQCVPAVVDGKDMLQVDGFQMDDELRSFLKSHGFTAGDPQIAQGAPTDTGEPNKRSVFAKEFFGRFSLPLAGVLNLIGDVGFLVNGIRTRDPYKMAGGSLYTLGGTNLATFGGNRKPVNRLNAVSQRLALFMKKTVGNLPEDSGLSHIEFKEEVAEKESAGGSFLFRNAANNTLAAYTAGAGAMLASGVQRFRKGEGSAGMLYGMSSVATKLTSLLIPEKPRNPEAENSGGQEGEKKGGIIGSAVDWIREKPLRIFGYGSLVTDSLLAIDTYQDFKRNPQKKNYVWTGVTTVTYMMADIMAAISNKNSENAGTKFDADEQRRVEALAAEAIAGQPADKQDALTEEVGGFLSTQPEMRGKRSDIVTSLKQQVQHMKSNPWAVRVMESASVATEVGKR